MTQSRLCFIAYALFTACSALLFHHRVRAQAVIGPLRPNPLAAIA